MVLLRQPAPASRLRRIPALPSLSALVAGLIPAVLILGCASPGPPRAPSLNLPQPVTDLVASRSGDTVQLRFTVPRLSTDKLPLYNPRHHRTALIGSLCREAAAGTCVPIAHITAPLTAADHTLFTWQETLPADLATGPARLLRYRVQFPGPHDRSAGWSNPAFTAAGTAPAAVTGLTAAGSRSGVLLQWTPASDTGQVLLHRAALAPDTPKHAADLWLNTNATGHRSLDTTLTAREPYRYTAVRSLTLTLDGHPVELRSATSAPLDVTLQPVYPPAAPTGLIATGFTPPDAADHYAVDLIWQPVSDADTSPRLAPPLVGYHVYRQAPNAPRTRLTAQPAPEPSFHDTTADPATPYQYSVTAVDAAGNESSAASITTPPSPR